MFSANLCTAIVNGFIVSIIMVVFSFLFQVSNKLGNQFFSGRLKDYMRKLKLNL